MKAAELEAAARRRASPVLLSDLGVGHSQPPFQCLPVVLAWHAPSGGARLQRVFQPVKPAMILAVGLVALVTAAVRGPVAEVLGESAEAADADDRITVGVARIGDGVLCSLRARIAPCHEQDGDSEQPKIERGVHGGPTPAQKAGVSGAGTLLALMVSLQKTAWRTHGRSGETRLR